MLSAVVLGVILLGVALLALRKPLYAGTPTEASKGVVVDESTIERLIKAKASKWNVDPAMIKAFCKIESDFNPNAVNPKDPSYGIMQIMPICGQDYGYVRNWRDVTQAEIDKLMDLETNLEIGTRHFANILSRYRLTYGLDACVQMYNVGVNGYINLNRRNSVYLSRWKTAYISYGGKA